MTDEEIFNEWKSEQYKDQSTEEKMEFVEHLHTFPQYFKKAFIAGLKTGRETEKEYVKNNAFTSMKEQGLFPFGKWHKVDDGDYPPYEKGNYTINVLTNCGDIAYYNYSLNCWIVEPSSAEIDPPIAWCEIPKFEE